MPKPLAPAACQSAALVVHDMGACTPLGLCARSTAAAIWADVSRVAAPDVAVAGESPAVYQAACPHIDADATHPARLIALGYTALAPMLEALDDVPGTLCIFVALPDCIVGLGARRHVVTRLQHALAPLRRAPLQSLSIKALWGQSGGFAASLGAAMRYLAAATSAELCLVGGIDSDVAPCRIAALRRAHALFDARSGVGTIVGEAAAFLTVSRRVDAAARPSLATLEAWHQTPTGAPTDAAGGLGAALACSVTQTLQTRGAFATTPIGLWLCDDTGEALRAGAIAHVLTRCVVPAWLGVAERVEPPTLMGHIGCASGPLGCIAATYGLRHSLVGGTQALASTQDSGHASAWLVNAAAQLPSILDAASARRAARTSQTSHKAGV